MNKGVTIGCVGVAAAVAVAIGLWMHPADPSIVAAVDPAPLKSSRFQGSAVAKGPRPVRPEAVAAAVPAGALPAAYRILLTRSIFCPHVAPARGAASSESTLALRGIVQLRRGFTAFIENTASGEAREIHIGDTVGHGKIIDIDLHSVEFVQGKRAMRVAVGQTFDGATSSAASASALAAVHAQLD